MARKRRRYTANARYRSQGLFAAGVGGLMVAAIPALLGFGRAEIPGADTGLEPLKLIGAALCVICAAILFGFGFFYLRPHTLLLDDKGGQLLRMGSKPVRWRWPEVDRVDWIAVGKGRYEPVEPYIVLRGFDPDAEREEREKYLVPLGPFSERAYAAVREQMLLHGS